MKGQKNCHSCRFSDWGYKYKEDDINPCEKCLGFDRWKKRHPDIKPKAAFKEVKCQ